MDLRAHTSREFEAELAAVKQKLVDMGHQVDELVEAAGRALVDRDVAVANRVILSDRATDAMELDLDHFCLEIVARRQPLAGDLRLLTSAFKVVVDLERVGDMGVSIATRVVELGEAPPLLPYDDLVSMLTTARGMVSDALGALVTEDVPRAERVIERDDVVDQYARRVFEELLGHMREDPSIVSRATRVQSISKYIERIGDHGTNIAERAIFALTGRDVSHQPRAARGAPS